MVEGFVCLHVTLSCNEVVVDGPAHGSLASVVVEQAGQLFPLRRGQFRMVGQVLHVADEFKVPAHEG